MVSDRRRRRALDEANKAFSRKERTDVTTERGGHSDPSSQDIILIALFALIVACALFGTPF